MQESKVKRQKCKNCWKTFPELKGKLYCSGACRQSNWYRNRHVSKPKQLCAKCKQELK